MFFFSCLIENLPLLGPPRKKILLATPWKNGCPPPPQNILPTPLLCSGVQCTSSMTVTHAWSCSWTVLSLFSPQVHRPRLTLSNPEKSPAKPHHATSDHVTSKSSASLDFYRHVEHQNRKRDRYGTDPDYAPPVKKVVSIVAWHCLRFFIGEFQLKRVWWTTHRCAGGLNIARSLRFRICSPVNHAKIGSNQPVAACGSFGGFVRSCCPV